MNGARSVLALAAVIVAALLVAPPLSTAVIATRGPSQLLKEYPLNPKARTNTQPTPGSTPPKAPGATQAPRPTSKPAAGSGPQKASQGFPVWVAVAVGTLALLVLLGVAARVRVRRRERARARARARPLAPRPTSGSPAAPAPAAPAASAASADTGSLPAANEVPAKASPPAMPSPLSEEQPAIDQPPEPPIVVPPPRPEPPRAPLPLPDGLEGPLGPGPIMERGPRGRAPEEPVRFGQQQVEMCVVGWRRRRITWEFVAMAVDPAGRTYPCATSPSFHTRGSGPPDGRSARAAHGALLRQLADSGWKPAKAGEIWYGWPAMGDNDEWYAQRFRRTSARSVGIGAPQLDRGDAHVRV